MHRGDHQMAGRRGAQQLFGGFRCAHFAHIDIARRPTQGAFDVNRPVFVVFHFDLKTLAALAMPSLQHVFDGIFDRHRRAAIGS